MSKMVRKQLAQTRAELEQDQRKKARARLKALRVDLRGARERRRVRKKEVTGECRAARKRISARAKEARARLTRSIERTRAKAKDLCLVARGEVARETLHEIDRAISALELERATQRQLALYTSKAKRSPSQKERGPGVSRAERRSESDDEVRANIDDPGLLVVWEKVKHKIKPKGRTSRTEVFAEWVAENSGDVYAIQEADLEAQIAVLERQERELSKALGKKRYREPAGLSAVPF